ncbi:MAG: protein phosphatase 2C domain-containing protein [Betaproteobacteria bacterium]|nr:protein phosphatase 2C domain-containing protein [Betaproteobacteria bacterium]
MMRLSVAQRSECGGRKRNEDWVGFCANDTRGCFVLADGTGGFGGGAIAARVVVKELLRHFSGTPEVNQHSISKTILTARTALINARKSYPRLSQMDTTMAVLMLDTQKALAYWSSLGDSRIYLFRHGRAHTLTNDHSVLQSMIDAGLISGSIRDNKKRAILYAAVGSGDIPRRAVCKKPLALRQGDTFLLCSDGFWESINESMMETVLQEAISPQHWINDMVIQVPNPKASNQDNFSALAIWVGDREEVTRIIIRKTHEHIELANQ